MIPNSDEACAIDVIGFSLPMTDKKSDLRSLEIRLDGNGTHSSAKFGLLGFGN
jgi:hypothetical protein